MIEWIYWLQDAWRAHTVGFFITGVFASAMIYFLMGWWHGWVFKKAQVEAARDAGWDQGFGIGWELGRVEGLKQGKAIGRARGERGRFVGTRANG